MCSVVIASRPGRDWPVIVAANRDEMADRPWKPPARHWRDRPEVISGLDEVGGGSWLGLNDDGLLAGVMNRVGSLGPDPERRSRGELVLEALDHADAAAAVAALAAIDAKAYRPFNMVVADNRTVYSLRSLGVDRVQARAVPAGVHMLTAHDLNDPASPRIAAYLPRFRAAPLPDPEEDAWDAWELLLATHDGAAGPEGAMCVLTETGSGTLSSSLIALPGSELWPRRPIWRFAAGRPRHRGVLRAGLVKIGPADAMFLGHSIPSRLCRAGAIAIYEPALTTTNIGRQGSRSRRPGATPLIHGSTQKNL